MNYLSHFFIDHSKGNHYFNTGLILPDITKNHIKTFKHIVHEHMLSENETALLNGCFKHYESDKRFHASPFFEKYNAIINHALNDAGMSEEVQRKWFISHILLELMIDRMMVRNDPGITDQFYFSLNAIDDHTFQRFLELYQIKDLDRFLKNFNHFREVQYIYYYTDNNKFVYSLNRIMMRAGLKEMSEEDSDKLLHAILQLETMYFSHYDQLINELKQVFA